MRARGSDVALGSLALGAVLLGAALMHAGLARRSALPEREAAARLVHRLGLSDLALFTEARYTRHPSQADLHSAFQDHPMSLDHFPSGSLVAPRGDTRPAGFGAARGSGAGR